MADKRKKDIRLHQPAKMLLDQAWLDVLAIESLDDPKYKDEDWSNIFEQIVSEGGSTYPYVLLGQVLAKATDNDVNALCLQDSSLLPGAVDVRSLVSKVVTPWNTSIGKPFPGSNADPYVNNPARYKNFGDDMESKAGNKAQYQKLLKVVTHIQEEGQQEAVRFLHLILFQARIALELNKKDFIGPSRASLEDVTKAVIDFLSERSSGVRLQVICYAIFKEFSQAFPDLGEVRSYPTNSSDASGGRAGDVECLKNGVVETAIEVKDRTLNLTDVESSIIKARVANVKNLIFLVQASPLLEDADAILKRAAHEFTRGTDVNTADAVDFFCKILIVLSPEQRASLLETIHDALHELGAHYKHVQKWNDLMKSI